MTLIVSKNKYERLVKVSTKNGFIEALAIDQRGALKKMMTPLKENIDEKDIIDFKTLVSKELTPYSSSILLDPEYGMPASRAKDKDAGLLLAYEETGYDANKKGRLPDLLPDLSVKRLKEAGADAVKFLLYYDVDEESDINVQKQAFVERLGSECLAEDMPFFLELLSYDYKDSDNTTLTFAKNKPHKVNEMTKLFSDSRYNVDVLKVEVPVNMKFVEGFSDGEIAYTRDEALGYFKEQSDATKLPYIFLSAGVSAELFQETLIFAKESGADFNGVLCGRATWKDSVAIYVTEGNTQAIDWLQTIGKENIVSLNKVVEKTATPWFEKVKKAD